MRPFCLPVLSYICYYKHVIIFFATNYSFQKLLWAVKPVTLIPRTRRSLPKYFTPDFYESPFHTKHSCWRQLYTIYPTLRVTELFKRWIWLPDFEGELPAVIWPQGESIKPSAILLPFYFILLLSIKKLKWFLLPFRPWVISINQIVSNSANENCTVSYHLPLILLRNLKEPSSFHLINETNFRTWKNTLQTELAYYGTQVTHQ